MIGIDKNRVKINQSKIQLQKQSSKIMNCAFSAFNTKGFQSSVNSGRLPQSDHITYEGAFNEIKFSCGPKAKQSMELHLGYARSQYSNSSFDNKINDYIAIFTKGSMDGEDRDERILNSVIVLDVSGSMGGSLTSKGEGNRLSLSKEAIKMFYSKLRHNDSFGLVIFNNEGKTLIPCTKKSQSNQQLFFAIIDTIEVNGGTTLSSGFNQAEKNLQTYLSNFSKDSGFENRILMITDVGDNSMTNAYDFVEKVGSTGIHTTIIGVSEDFRSEYCEKMNEIEGFNYFCATQISDLKKYLFENFSFTFFPSNYNIEIGLQSKQVDRFQVFGTSDAKRVSSYNSQTFGQIGKRHIITKTKTSFPSEIQIHNGQLKTYGGLIIVKLKLLTEQTDFIGQITLTYTTPKGQKHFKQYPINYNTPKGEQYYSDQSLSEALSALYYVYQVKSILQKANISDKKDHQLFKKYCEGLRQLKEIAPKTKLQQLQKTITALDKFAQQNKQKPLDQDFD